MVYEHLSRCFIPKDPSSGFSKLFQVVIVVTHGHIPKLVALMLGVIRLLAMLKDINGLCLIIIGDVFFRFISRSIVLQLQGPFQEHLSPLEAMKPSLLVSKPSSIYTLIGS
jgi:hypothetical protein